ncbi:MAG: acyltransferase family protein [Lachnospiraceae bacterium]|nr:acyltransferase family protein [Lachnospiraceae bacterium]
MEKRDNTIDILKGIGIILVVAGHSGSPLMHYIYLFHMALFFIASGYCFKSRYSENAGNLLSFLKKRLLSLWLPYFLWLSICSVLHNVFLNIHIYATEAEALEYPQYSLKVMEAWSIKELITNSLKAAIFHGWEQMAGAMWFVAVLFELSLAYCIGDYMIRRFVGEKRRIVIQGIVAVLFLGIGFVFAIMDKSILGLERVLSYYSLYFLGNLMREKGIMTKPGIIGKILMIILGTILLAVCGKYASVDLGGNMYKDPIFLIIVSLAGWILLYGISEIISRVKPVAQIITRIGRHTMAVIALHFLAFKLVDKIAISIKNEPEILLAEFPVHYEGLMWRIIYRIAGVGLPVMAAAAYAGLKKHLKGKK